jgi:poly(3-hydroxybutyrate) depolymerase
VKDNINRGSLEPELGRREFAQSMAGAAAVADISPASADERADARGLDPVAESFTPTDWDVLGPFQYQRRGVETGWLVPNGSKPAHATGKSPDEGQQFQSAFAGGLTVTWLRNPLVRRDDDTPRLHRPNRPDGRRLDAPDRRSRPVRRLSRLVRRGSILYAKGYVVASFEMEMRRRAVLETDASVAWLNGKCYEELPVGVVLQEGTNHLLLKNTLVFGGGSVSVSFRPPRAPVEVNSLASFRGTPQNAILPDLREGRETDRPASVRVTNTTGEELAPTLTFAPDSDLVETRTVTVNPPLAPFETRRVNTRVVTTGGVPKRGASAASAGKERVPGIAMSSTDNADLADSDRVADAGGGKFEVEATSSGVTATVSVGDQSDERAIPLRIRRADETRWQTTFVSEHDETVQEFSVREPTNPGSDGPFKLVVSLHGANVPSINQAGANVQRKDAYVVAPGARGPVNYDQEDLGRLDDLEAIRVMKDRYDIDENAVYLTGHSMGGHGAWHVGLTNPDRFAGLAPSAGWTDHETYLTVTFDRNKLHTFPRIKAVCETALQKNLALPKTENAADGTLPVFALHGREDASVPTIHPRTYLRALANRGLSVRGEVGGTLLDARPGRRRRGVPRSPRPTALVGRRNRRGYRLREPPRPSNFPALDAARPLPRARLLFHDQPARRTSEVLGRGARTGDGSRADAGGRPRDPGRTRNRNGERRVPCHRPSNLPRVLHPGTTDRDGRRRFDFRGRAGAPPSISTCEAASP